MHNIFRGGIDQTQNKNKEDICSGRDPVRVHEPKPRLQEDSGHREDRGEAEALLGEEEAVRVGLHGPERQRKVGDPEKDARPPERG